MYFDIKYESITKLAKYYISYENLSRKNAYIKAKLVIKDRSKLNKWLKSIGEF